MQRTEFENQISRLEATFGKIPPDRLGLIWNAVKNKGQAWMDSAVNNFIGNMRSQPLLKDFLARMEDEDDSQKKLPMPSRVPEVTNCPECSGAGYTFFSDSKGYRFIARCYCASGAAKPSTLSGKGGEECRVPQVRRPG